MSIWCLNIQFPKTTFTVNLHLLQTTFTIIIFLDGYKYFCFLSIYLVISMVARNFICVQTVKTRKTKSSVWAEIYKLYVHEYFRFIIDC